ncbi:hypothetical protein ACMFMG_000161 [Clarireedia jacksonii]
MHLDKDLVTSADNYDRPLFLAGIEALDDGELEKSKMHEESQSEDCHIKPAASPTGIDPELSSLKATLRSQNFNSLTLVLEQAIERLPASAERAKMLFVAGLLQHKYHCATKKKTRQWPRTRLPYPTNHVQIEELFRKALTNRPWESKKHLRWIDSEDGKAEGQPNLKRRKTKALPNSEATEVKDMSSNELSEEDKHPWRVLSQMDIPDSGMLWRVWDKRSACKIDDGRVGFLSGSPDYCLGLAEDRAFSIGDHANWGCRRLSPYISTTSSFAEIVHHRVPQLEIRQKKNVGQPTNIKLTLINARARVAAKMPVLRMTKELDHYHVKTPYGNIRDYKNSFFEHEYLCPFVIPPSEIVQTFTWDSVQQWAKENNAPPEEWATVVGQKAFDEHENARLLGCSSTSTQSCHCCGHGDGCTCCGHVIHTTKPITEGVLFDNSLDASTSSGQPTIDVSGDVESTTKDKSGDIDVGDALSHCSEDTMERISREYFEQEGWARS